MKSLSNRTFSFLVVAALALLFLWVATILSNAFGGLI